MINNNFNIIISQQQQQQQQQHQPQFQTQYNTYTDSYQPQLSQRYSSGSRTALDVRAPATSIKISMQSTLLLAPIQQPKKLTATNLQVMIDQ